MVFINSSLNTLGFVEPVDLSTVRLANAYNDVGVTLLRQSQFEQAIDHFKRAIAVAEGLPALELAKLHYNVGLVHLRLEQEMEAIQEFEQALQHMPEFAPATYQLLRMEYERQNRKMGYEFGEDWFSRNIPPLRATISAFAGQFSLRMLEVGSWEGRSTCWFLTHLLTHDAARIVCVDTFTGADEQQAQFDATIIQTVQERFDRNIARTGAADKVMKLVGESKRMLRSLAPVPTFDLIYIDGSHWCHDVLTDAVLSWDLLKVGGWLIFDDYDAELRYPEQRTRIGIDAFLAAFQEQFQVVHQSHLVVVKKTERRRGGSDVAGAS